MNWGREFLYLWLQLPLVLAPTFMYGALNTVVDVGGGRGSLIAAILKAHSTLKGILFDVPTVIEDASPQLAANGIADRCAVVAGNFFESVPVGGDAYLLKWIIHDWDDAKAIAILKNCHQAMSDNSRLLLIELVISPGDERSFGQLMDVNMLVMMGGRERTDAEYRSLLQAAGFQLTGIILTSSPVSVIEAIKAFSNEITLKVPTQHRLRAMSLIQLASLHHSLTFDALILLILFIAVFQ